MAATAPPLAPLEDVWKNGTSPPTTKPLPHVQRDVEDRIGYRFKKPELLANVFHAKWQGVLAILGNNLARLLITQYFASAFPENEEHHTNNGMGPMLAHRVAAGFALRLGLDGLLEDDGGIRNDGEYIVKMVIVFHSLLAVLYLDAGEPSEGLDAARTLLIRCYHPGDGDDAKMLRDFWQATSRAPRLSRYRWEHRSRMLQWALGSSRLEFAELSRAAQALTETEKTSRVNNLLLARLGNEVLQFATAARLFKRRVDPYKWPSLQERIFDDKHIANCFGQSALLKSAFLNDTSGGEGPEMHARAIKALLGAAFLDSNLGYEGAHNFGAQLFQGLVDAEAPSPAPTRAPALTPAVPAAPVVQKWPFELVLDLDLTLVYVHNEEPFHSVDAKPPDGWVALKLFTDKHGHHSRFMRPRPHLKRFLREASKHCSRLHVYTASHTPYAEEILRHIDPDGLITGIKKSWPHCDRPPPKKSLRQMNPSVPFMKRALILDDQLGFWEKEFQDRVIIAKPFVGNTPETDEHLMDVLQFLKLAAERHRQLDREKAYTGDTLLAGRTAIFKGMVFYLADEGVDKDTEPTIGWLGGTTVVTPHHKVTHIVVSGSAAQSNIPRGHSASIVHWSYVRDCFFALRRLDELAYKRQ